MAAAGVAIVAVAMLMLAGHKLHFGRAMALALPGTLFARTGLVGLADTQCIGHWHTLSEHPDAVRELLAQHGHSPLTVAQLTPIGCLH